MKYLEQARGFARRVQAAPLTQRTQSFIEHWSKEIVVAVALAIVAALALEWYAEERSKRILDANLRATVVVMAKSGDEESQGSGFFISKDGLLATNYHVIKGAKVDQIVAQLPATRAIYRAKQIVGADQKRDVALVQFDARDTPYVPLGDSSTIESGQRVIAIGAPLGLESTVSDGIVSNPSRQMGGLTFIQFTAPISPGSSGGGLFEKHGTVIGITSGTLSEEETPGQNLNLAVPINVLRDTVSGKETELTTESATYYLALGGLEEGKHNFDKALAYYMKAIRLDDGNADAYLGAGGIFYEHGDYDSEVKYYEKAVELAPDDYEAVSLLGSAYEDVGNYDDAIRMYRKAIELKENDKDSMFTLAILSILTGDIEAARQILPSLMKLNAGTGKELEALIAIASTSETLKRGASKAQRG